ncbi:RES family NAD+ phosphorylase [Streptomyces sp. UH6]|uniref:RES family NAD+ phosphorylase n=1 Tax=Streptomyces sp. UH6 TaxID=2748379 RepID=UPI0015D4A942|nr:RES family NAD+ phosphorylase [Streptomyces sp. UH6]NYV77370.1 RES family NAD+ phosphorylase [Streptomyces sp. UH6]
MALQVPPEGVKMEPVLTVLPAGTLVWRCHSEEYGPVEFNPNPAHLYFKGNRFDATERDPYPYLYAALEPLTALAEVFLRSVEFDGPGAVRRIPWAQASRYLLTAVRTTADVRLVDLTTAEGLATVWQDEWLVDCEHREYDKTRYWVQVIREHCSSAQGLRWVSKRCRPREAVQFFGDRGEPFAGARGAEARYRLGRTADVREVNRMLSRLRAVISVSDGSDSSDGTDGSDGSDEA